MNLSVDELLLCGFLLLPVGGDDALGQNMYFPKIQSYHESGNIGIHVLAKFQLVLLVSWFFNYLLFTDTVLNSSVERNICFS